MVGELGEGEGKGGRRKKIERGERMKLREMRKNNSKPFSPGNIAKSFVSFAKCRR